MNRIGLTDSIILMGLLFVLLAPEARAYLDPSTGSFIAQTVVAAFIGAIISFRKMILAKLSIFKAKSPDLLKEEKHIKHNNQ